jgi:hypothetical protein
MTVGKYWHDEFVRALIQRHADPSFTLTTPVLTDERESKAYPTSTDAHKPLERDWSLLLADD